MGNDSFVDFISQSGIINLILAVVVLGVLWVSMFILAIQRGNERRRRRREGEPPLPNIFVQFYNLVIGLSQPNADNTASAHNTNSAGETRMPSLNDLTNDLPEPDFGSMFDAPPPPATPADIPAPPAAQVETASTSTDHDDLPNPDSEYSAPDDIAVGEEPQRIGATYIVGRNELPEDAVEIMRIWRDVTDGALIMQMGNRVFETIPELGDKTFAKRFISVVEELGRIAQAGALASGMPAPNFQQRTAVISQQGDWANRVKPAPMPIATPPPVVTDAVVGQQTTGSPTGIAGQIEELLQFRLSHSPVFQHRSIHVRSNPNGSLRIEVDGRNYNHVDDVIDPDVRDFIRATIREWEARQ